MKAALVPKMYHPTSWMSVKSQLPQDPEKVRGREQATWSVQTNIITIFSQPLEPAMGMNGPGATSPSPLDSDRLRTQNPTVQVGTQSLDLASNFPRCLLKLPRAGSHGILWIAWNPVTRDP